MLKCSTRHLSWVELQRVKGITRTWQFGFAKTISADHVQISKLPDHIGDSMEGTWALPEHSTTQKFVPIGALAGMSRVLFFGRSIFSFQTGLMDEFSTAAIFTHEPYFRPGVTLDLSIHEFSKSYPGEQLRLVSRAIKVGYFVGHVEFSVQSEMDGRPIMIGRQAKFFPVEKYPKVWELSTKCIPLVSALLKRYFARQQLNTEGWVGLISKEGCRQVHFEDLFSSNGEGKLICTPQTQNWFDGLQGGAAISAAEQFLREKKDEGYSSSSYHTDPLLRPSSYIEASYMASVGLGDGYNLELDDTTEDVYHRKTSTINLLNDHGKIACRIRCFDSHK